jgi:hypothetical protein
MRDAVSDVGRQSLVAHPGLELRSDRVEMRERILQRAVETT